MSYSCSRRQLLLLPGVMPVGAGPNKRAIGDNRSRLYMPSSLPIVAPAGVLLVNGIQTYVSRTPFGFQGCNQLIEYVCEL